MKIALALTPAALFALAGCAGTPMLNPPPTAITTAGTYYCWQERLGDSSPNLVCNWERSPADACNSRVVATIAKSSASAVPQRSHRCENGQWLVSVTTR